MFFYDHKAIARGVMRYRVKVCKDLSLELHWALFERGEFREGSNDGLLSFCYFPVSDGIDGLEAAVARANAAADNRYVTVC